MNIMSLDCEYNQPSGKTIQIGAAVFNVKTGDLIDKLEVYVNPGELINDGKNGYTNIIELTGIKDSDVANAPQILEAYLLLKKLHEKHKCYKNPLVWGAGASNDSNHIYIEAYPNKEEKNFMGYRVIDVKGIYQSSQLFSNKTVKGGLKKACDNLGLGFEGEPHRALNDAINTFKVWYFLMNKFKID